MACDLCDGMGMRMVERNGKRSAAPCVCVTEAKIEQATRRAGIPARYVGASFETFRINKSGNIGAMFRAVQRYTSEFLPGTNNGGLLLTGTIGVGKTHLAVAALRSLILDKGQVGLFVDARELLNRLRATYGPGSSQTSTALLDPVLSADVVVLDELGAARATDWTADVIEYVINGRYNAQRSTIVTTNYPLLGPVPVASAERPQSVYSRENPAYTARETLADRIGARMYSRVVEMCRAVQVSGEDYRQRIAAQLVAI